MPTSADVRALGEFAAARHGTFTLRQAARLGVTRHDIRRLERDGIVVRVRPSIWRFTAVRRSWRTDTYAGVLGRRVAAARRTACALHGIEGLSTPPIRPQLVRPHSSNVRMPGYDVVTTRDLPRRDLTVVDGITCTHLIRTICDIAPHVTPNQLLRAVDDLQRRGVSMRALHDRAAELRVTGRAGPATVMELTQRRLDGYRVPDSWFERLIEACLDSDLLPGLERQFELRDDDGVFVARFDLAFPWARQGIECHSRSFHLGETVEQYDEDRDLRAAKVGWDIAYLGFAATRSPAAVRTDIEQIVRRRADDLGLTPPARLWLPPGAA